MGNACTQDDLRWRKRARSGAWRRNREKESPGFAQFTYYFIGTTPGFFDEIRATGKALSHPSVKQPMGEVNASLASVPWLDAKSSHAGVLYGPESSPWRIACLTGSAMRVAIRCRSAACGNIVRRYRSLAPQCGQQSGCGLDTSIAAGGLALKP